MCRQQDLEIGEIDVDGRDLNTTVSLAESDFEGGEKCPFSLLESILIAGQLLQAHICLDLNRTRPEIGTTWLTSLEAIRNGNIESHSGVSVKCTLLDKREWERPKKDETWASYKGAVKIEDGAYELELELTCKIPSADVLF